MKASEARKIAEVSNERRDSVDNSMNVLDRIERAAREGQCECNVPLVLMTPKTQESLTALGYEFEIGVEYRDMPSRRGSWGSTKDKVAVSIYRISW